MLTPAASSYEMPMCGPNKSFFMSIGYGDVVHGTRYITETRAGEKQVGGGTVTVTLHGQDATITFDASSADGVSYTGAIQCSGVSRY